jgi:hypothetical protein
MFFPPVILSKPFLPISAGAKKGGLQEPLKFTPCHISLRSIRWERNRSQGKIEKKKSVSSL